MNKRKLVTLFYWVLGLGTLANGIWMLISPATWYTELPAGVPDTGPLNSHFVHDLGVVFAIAGAGAIWCARNLERCAPVHVGITAFIAGHALVHVIELMVGLLPADHWWMDAPLVFVPAAILLAITPAILRGGFREAPP